MAEFTGERVVPDQVDADLWNEHLSRYVFTSRLSRGKRVLDIGCGTGYGAARLGDSAAAVIGVDISAEAVAYANEHYSGHKLSFAVASGMALPFAAAAFDLVIAFEMIEHLTDWEALLAEARRVLRPSGQFVVSTPNTRFYAESRRKSGPNPFHEHEFEFEEFRDALGRHFPHVSLFLQNHGPSITFQPIEAATGAEVRVEGKPTPPDESNFFVAVCAAVPQTGAPAFVHVPTTANVLRERSQHILKLEGELATKDQWLEEAKGEHEELVASHREVVAELEERNRWAESLDAELAEARDKLDRFHGEKEVEIAALTDGFRKVAESYEEQIVALEAESERQSRWAMETQQSLDAKIKELAHCVDVLHETEKTVAERTAWAQSLNTQVEELTARLARVDASRWVRLGRAVGLGPRLRDDK